MSLIRSKSVGSFWNSINPVYKYGNKWYEVSIVGVNGLNASDK